MQKVIERKTEDLLLPIDMAKILSVKPSWLYRQTMKKGPGTIPRVMVGKYLRFKKSEVLSWVEQNQREVMQNGK